MYIAETCALAAAFCWSLNGIIATTPVRALGAIAFNRIRMTAVFIILGAACTYLNLWANLKPHEWMLLIGSACIGIIIGDTALQSTLIRVGPRRTGILYSASAPCSAALAYWFLGEQMSLSALFGSALIVLGIILAILSGTNNKESHSYEQVRGNLIVGVALGLLGAFSQAVAMVMIRPILHDGFNAFVAGTLRIGIAAFLLNLHLLFFSQRAASHQFISFYFFYRTVASGMLGMGVGMTFFLTALSYGQTGLVATLASTMPILVLPQLWILTGQVPKRSAWAGAVMAISGATMLFIH